MPRGVQPEGSGRRDRPVGIVSVNDGGTDHARRGDAVAPATAPAARHAVEALPVTLLRDDPAPPPRPPTTRGVGRFDVSAVGADAGAGAGAADGAAMFDTRGDLARINDVLDNLFAVEPSAAAAAMTATHGRAARSKDASSNAPALQTASTLPVTKTAARQREEAATVNGVWERLDQYAALAEKRQRAEEAARDDAERKARVEANERERAAEVRRCDADAEAEAQAIVEQWLTPLNVDARSDAAGARSTSPLSRREVRVVRTPREEARLAQEEEAAREAVAQRARETADDARRSRDVEARIDAGVQRAIDRAIADALGDAPIEMPPSLTPDFAIPDFIAKSAAQQATAQATQPLPLRSGRWGAPPPDSFVPKRSPPPYTPPPPPAAVARVHVNRAGSVFVGRPEARGLYAS